MLFVLRAVIKRGARQMVVCKMVVKADRHHKNGHHKPYAVKNHQLIKALNEHDNKINQKHAHSH